MITLDEDKEKYHIDLVNLAVIAKTSKTKLQAGQEKFTEQASQPPV